MATVIIPSMMTDVTGGTDRVELPGRTLKAVVEALVARFPGIRERLLDNEEQLQPYVALFVDGVEVRRSEGLLVEVDEGAEVVIVPALGGGAA